MVVSTLELAQARQAAGSLLEELGLEAYLFEIEPKEGEWELRLECAMPGGWQTLRLPVEKDTLLAARDDAAIRSNVREAWQSRLSQYGGTGRGEKPTSS